MFSDYKFSLKSDFYISALNKTIDFARFICNNIVDFLLSDEI